MISLLHLLSYVGALTAFVFVTLSLASGLLWIAELIEEQSRLAKVVGVRAIYVIIVLHALLYVTDALPFGHTVFSIFCHLVYLQHFSHSWPFISLTSPVFILSCVLVVVDHFIWFFHFAAIAQEAKKYRAAKYRYSHQPTIIRNAPSFMDVAAFFAICVWFIPLFLFLSLSANDNVIPSFDTSAPPSPMGATIDLSGTPQASAPRSRRSVASSSLMKAVLAPVMGFIPRLGRRRTADGLIAPQRSSSPLPSSTLATEGYSPWGSEYSASTPPPPMYSSTSALGLGPEGSGSGTRGAGAFTPPPLRRPTSTPPKSRSNSVMQEAQDEGASSQLRTPTNAGGRRPPMRRQTLGTDRTDDGGRKDD